MNKPQEINPKCLKCQRDCKQSAMAEILFCPQYEEKKEIKGGQK